MNPHPLIPLGGNEAKVSRILRGQTALRVDIANQIAAFLQGEGADK